ncbi:MAG: hypothetical protein ACI97N_000367 [Cognaticolwellia sp.]|jgi:hypothetical protein
MKLLKILCLLILSVSSVMAQNEDVTFISSSITSQKLKIPHLNIGAEVQFYPAGWIYGARADLYLGKHANWNFRLAYNDIDRKDFSTKNDTEVGGGFGASLGYRYYFGKRKGLFLGARMDIRDLTIDWKDADNLVVQEGSTDILVFQPTAEIGYQIILKKHWAIAPTWSTGYEWNVMTDGDDVMGSWIGLIGLNIGYKLF